MRSRKPRAYAVLRGTAPLYSVYDRTFAPDDARCWSVDPAHPIGLALYSDGTTRIHGDTVKWTQTVSGRRELIVLVLVGPNAPLPNYTAIAVEDWRAWQRRVRDAGDPASLPRLPHRKV